jgi:glycosyltransferase involved in cell wall biosynthesis
MIIAFVHNNKAFLPGMYAYTRFFSAYEIQCEVVNKNELGLVHRNVEWWMMGSDLSKPKEGILKIHEYCFSSLPPWRDFKNKWKSFCHTQPDFRLFLNEYVRKSLNFHDRIPFGYRDIGIPDRWLHETGNVEKEYDFIYTGDVSPIRQPERLLNCFSTGTLKDRSLLVISKNYQQLQAAYQGYRNIVFMGPIPYHDMESYIQKARFGINFMVDMEPFNQQSSTRMLEYAALGLAVVTTRYAWTENFQQHFGGDYFFLEPDLSNFTWENVNKFPYTKPDLSQWTWDKQIRGSGVLEFLQEKFPELRFG